MVDSVIHHREGKCNENPSYTILPLRWGIGKLIVDNAEKRPFVVPFVHYGGYCIGDVSWSAFTLDCVIGMHRVLPLDTAVPVPFQKVGGWACVDFNFNTE